MKTTFRDRTFLQADAVEGRSQVERGGKKGWARAGKIDPSKERLTGQMGRKG